MDASIIIRAKNEAADIGETLEAVFNQKSVGQFEVIVVDSGSTDRTVEIATQYPVNLVEIRPETFTYGRALNLGVDAAEGDYTISLSAHSLPADSHWLANIIEPFQDSRVGAVYGRHLPRANVTRLELLGMQISGVTSTQPRRQTRNNMFSNANGAHRRCLLLEHPFDEIIPGAEDLAWADWIERQGWTVCYQPSAAVYHSHGESLPRLIRRMIHDQPTIWGLKLGILTQQGRIERKEIVAPAPVAAPESAFPQRD